MVEAPLWRRVRDIINMHDPLDLIKTGCPEDEYTSEAKSIARRLRRIPSVEVYNMVSHTFERAFGLKPGEIQPFELVRDLSKLRTT